MRQPQQHQQHRRRHSQGWTIRRGAQLLQLPSVLLLIVVIGSHATCQAFSTTSTTNTRLAGQRRLVAGGSVATAFAVAKSHNRHRPSSPRRSTKPAPTSLFASLPTDPEESSLDTDNEETGSSFNGPRIRAQWRLFRQLAGPYLDESVPGRWLLAGTLALTLLNSGVSVVFSYLGKDFWNALSAKDVSEYYTVLQHYLGALLVGAPVVTLYKFQREQLAVHWREWMTTRTLELYTQNRVYYALDENEIDNPDQRITEDVNSFTAYSLQLVITVLTSIIDLVSFSTILWGIYPQLFLAIIGYAVFGTLITLWLGQPLGALNFAQLQKEADLRYVLVRFRDAAEAIALYGGEALERVRLQNNLDSAIDNQRRLNRASRNLEFFTNGYRYLVQILPVAVVAPQYFAGQIALGVISQSVGAFNHILSDLSILVNQFERLSSFSAGLDRLGSFYQAMQEQDGSGGYSDEDDGTESKKSRRPLLQLAPETPVATMMTKNGEDSLPTTPLLNSDGVIVTEYWEPFSQTLLRANRPPSLANATLSSAAPPSTKKAVVDPILEVDDLTLCTPDGKRQLIQNLSFTLHEGQHLLIVGNSGAGKSSLLRALAGLWTNGEGTLRRPIPAEVTVLPQKPYCPLGSLREQLLYPYLLSTTTTTSASLSDTGNENEKEDVSSISAGEVVVNNNVTDTRALPPTDTELLDILSEVNLLYVAESAGDGNATAGLDSVLDWTNVLSLGEQQRLAFARLLVHHEHQQQSQESPRLVIADEATSALDLVAEARMYTLLQNLARRDFDRGTLSRPGLTYISVGHRPSLVAYHNKRLRLSGGEDYEFSDIEKSSVQLSSLAQTKNL